MPQILPINPQMPILFKAIFDEAEVYSEILATWSLSRIQGREMCCRGNGDQQTIASSSAGCTVSTQSMAEEVFTLYWSRRVWHTCIGSSMTDWLAAFFSPLLSLCVCLSFSLFSLCSLSMPQNVAELHLPPVFALIRKYMCFPVVLVRGVDATKWSVPNQTPPCQIPRGRVW